MEKIEAKKIYIEKISKGKSNLLEQYTWYGLPSKSNGDLVSAIAPPYFGVPTSNVNSH